MHFTATAVATFLLFFAYQTYAQTEGSGIIIRVMVDGVATDYYEGACGYGTANWGGAITDEFCAGPAWGYDITPDSLACDSIPAGQLNGKIALIRRGVCGFSIKALNAQKAGAVACIIVNLLTTGDDCYTQSIGATQPQAGETTIPCFFACRNMGNQIDAAIKAGQDVQVCFMKPDIDISSYFYPASNVQTPASQIATDTFGFGAYVSNLSATISRTNVEVKASVLDASNNSLYTTSTVVPELAPGVLDSFITLPGLYVPALGVGTYHVMYTTHADPANAATPLDDRASGAFYVTQNLFAKDDGATIGYRPSSITDSWGLGNLYNMSAGSLDNYEVKQVEFTFATNASEIPASDVQSTFYLFKINDDVLDDWSNFDDTELLSSSMEWLGTAVYEAPDNMTNYTMQAVDLTSLATGEIGIPVQAGKRYMVVNQYSTPSQLVFNGFNENYVLPTALVHTTIFNGQWFLGGFGDGINAVLRMYIDLVNTTDEKKLSESVMQIVPNPVRETLNLAISFDQPTDATITVADISGRVINVEDRQGLTNEMVSYQLPQLTAGTYLARIATKEGTLTKKFIVQK